MASERLPDRLTEALAYASRGWHVFPLLGKRPATQHGWKDATTDRETIVAWWAGTVYNVGIATGPSGLLVVDLDGDDALAWWYEQGAPDTAWVTTGRGQHHYFRAEGLPSTTGRLAPNVDTRGVGGYVVAPPSVHPATGARYEWAGGQEVLEAPEGLRKALRPRRQRRPSIPVPGAGPDWNVRHLVRRVQAAPEGSRNVRLYGSARDASLWTKAFPDLPARLIRAGMEAGLGYDECLRTVASGLGVTTDDLLDHLEARA